MIWALRWSVALRTFYRQILSLLYSSFPFGNFRPRLVRALLVIIIYIYDPVSHGSPQPQGMVPYSYMTGGSHPPAEIRKARASTYRCVTATGLISGHAMGRVMIFLGGMKGLCFGIHFFSRWQKIQLLRTMKNCDHLVHFFLA